MSELLHIETAARRADLPVLILMAATCLGRSLPHTHTPDGVHIESDDLKAWLARAEIAITDEGDRQHVEVTLGPARSELATANREFLVPALILAVGLVSSTALAAVTAIWAPSLLTLLPLGAIAWLIS